MQEKKDNGGGKNWTNRHVYKVRRKHGCINKQLWGNSALWVDYVKETFKKSMYKKVLDNGNDNRQKEKKVIYSLRLPTLPFTPSLPPPSTSII